MPMQGVRFARSAIATAVMAATVPAAASAATFEVTTKQDRAGACDANCALREAVLAAGETAADDVIVLRRGTYALTREGSDEDGGLTGDLDVAQETSTMVSSGALDVRGRGAKATRIDANGIDRALHLLDDAAGAGPPVELRRLTIRGGRVSGDDGGGLRVEDARSLTLKNVLVAGNRTTAIADDGGGIENRGSLALDRSTVRDNQALNDGGGISMNGGDSLTIERSTVSGNSAGGPDGGGDGGGIYAPADATSSAIVNSTISGNRARGTSSQGGGVYVSGELDLTFATVASNDATGDAGGALNTVGADVGLAGTLIARNDGQAGSKNCGGSGVVNAGAANLEDRNTCGLGGFGDLPGASPGLKPLAANDGPTRTHALKPGSDAVDAADGIPCLTRDQRGTARPQGDDCDIGAFERRQ